MISQKALRSALFVMAAASCLNAISFAQSGSSGRISLLNANKPKEQIRVEINAGIEKYSPIMSSVPGMPLIAVVRGIKVTTKMKYRWQTQGGSLLLWQAPDFIVQNKGGLVLTSSDRVYWSPMLPETKAPYTVQVGLEVLDEKDNVIGKAEIVLNIDQKLMVTVKK